MGLFRRSTLCLRSLTIFILSIVALVVAVFILVCSPTMIISPTAPVAPITVYVTDYGYHGRLILPARQDRQVNGNYLTTIQVRITSSTKTKEILESLVNEWLLCQEQEN